MFLVLEDFPPPGIETLLLSMLMSEFKKELGPPLGFLPASNGVCMVVNLPSVSTLVDFLLLV